MSDSSVKLHKTISDNGITKYIIVKSGVYFGMTLEQVKEMNELTAKILCENDNASDNSD